MMRVCAEPGCGNLTTNRRCDACAPQVDRRRGTTKERGYTGRYRTERNRMANRMRQGKYYACWRCHQIILTVSELSLGHCDDDRTVIHGAEHLACNLAHTRGGCTHESHQTTPSHT